MPTSFNKVVAETSHSRAVVREAGAQRGHAVYRLGTKAQLSSSSQQHGMGIAQKLGGFASGDLLGAQQTARQPGLSCSKGAWQTQAGFIQEKSSFGAHPWVLLKLFLFLIWAEVNLKCKYSLNMGNGNFLSLKCPCKIFALLKYTLFLFPTRNICRVWPKFRSVLVPSCFLGEKEAFSVVPSWASSSTVPSAWVCQQPLPLAFPLPAHWPTPAPSRMPPGGLCPTTR